MILRLWIYVSFFSRQTIGVMFSFAGRVKVQNNVQKQCGMETQKSPTYIVATDK
jgi:hypothetical protein